MPMIDAGADVLALGLSAHLIAVCRDEQARIWNPANSQAIRQVPLPGKHRLWALNPHLNLVASVDAQQRIHLRSLVDGKTLHVFDGGGAWLRRIGISPDGKRLASGGDDQQIRVWDTASGKVVWSGPNGDGSATQIVFSPDNRLLFCANSDTDLRQWSASNGELLRRWDQFPLTAFAACFSQDGRRIVLGGADRKITVLDATSGQVTKVIETGTELVAGLAISSSGDRALVGGMNKDGFRLPVAVSLWDLNSGTRLWADRLSRSSSLVELSSDGRLAVWNSFDRKIVLRAA